MSAHTGTGMDPDIYALENSITARLNGTAPTAIDAPLTTRTLREMADDPLLSRPPEWIVEPYFERGSLNSVYGPGKIGKSTMLADIAVHVGTSRAWAGHTVQGGPVLWIDLEQGERRLVRNFMRVADWDTADIVTYSNLGKRPDYGATLQTLADLQPALVIIDSLAKFCEIEDDNDNAAWQNQLRPLEELARTHRAAFVAIDHDRKSEGEHGRAMRGASSKLAAFDTAIHVKRGAGTIRKLEVVSREVGDLIRSVERTDDGYRLASEVNATCSVLAALMATGESVSVKVLHQYITRQGITTSARTVATRLKAAVDEGKATVTGTGTKSDPQLFSAIEVKNDGNP